MRSRRDLQRGRAPSAPLAIPSLCLPNAGRLSADGGIGRRDYESRTAGRNVQHSRAQSASARPTIPSLDFLDAGRGPEHSHQDVQRAYGRIQCARASSARPTVHYHIQSDNAPLARLDIPSLGVHNTLHALGHRERDPGSGSLNEGKGTGDSSALNLLRSIGLEIVGFDKGRQSVCDRTNNERFSASFGVSAKTLLAIFIDLKRKNPNMKEVDFLLAMNALKLYLTEKVMAGRWKCHEETYRHKWKTGVAAIAALRDYKIKFDPSDFPDDQIFLLSIDGVNCTMNEPRVYREQVANRELAVVPPPTLKLGPGSHWYDHKSHSAGVSYEVGVDVRRSRICWINGPKPGKKYISLCIL